MSRLFISCQSSKAARRVDAGELYSQCKGQTTNGADLGSFVWFRQLRGSSGKAQMLDGFWLYRAT
jgi:hypothetical protein